MPVLHVDRLRAYRVPDHCDRYDAKDTILYALGIGAGLSDAVDERRMVFERELVAMPTMAVVLGTPGFWAMDPATGIDWPRVLHGEQVLRLHRVFDPQGEVLGRTVIGALADKGIGKPAILEVRRTLETPAGELIAEMEEIWVLREAGGFGGDRALDRPAPAPMPDWPADACLTLPTSRNQAMLYRLSGDRNPLHVDPASAALGDFDAPILHGLATMGVVARALVHLCAAGDPSRLRAIAVRFTAPVHPGEAISTEIWREDGRVRFRARTATMVIDHGTAEFWP